MAVFSSTTDGRVVGAHGADCCTFMCRPNRSMRVRMPHVGLPCSAEEKPQPNYDLLTSFEALQRNVVLSMEIGVASASLNANAMQTYCDVKACGTPHAAPSDLLLTQADQVGDQHKPAGQTCS